MPELLSSSPYPPEHERPAKVVAPPPNQVLERSADKFAGLTTRESVELFQEAVDTARDELQRPLNNEAAGVDIRPRLTVDLRGRGLSHLPKEVVAIIKHDVERLHLANNQLSHIAIEFTQCLALKYLNLKGNKFKEIPKAIFGLPQLEILDVSKNKISEVPDEIENNRALRVLSIQHNNIQDLPYCLGSINTLRMIKLNNNPLNPNLQRLLTEGGADLPGRSQSIPFDEHERDTRLTKKILRHMQDHYVPKDSGEESTSEGPMETPRAQSRFPVQPQYGHHTSGSESASDLRSPVFPRPPMPTRSHTRVPSNQYNASQNGAPRRPGLAPLTLGSERNRSNSESWLQSTKSKRIGFVRKRPGDLGIVDETRANRNSHHFRGQSAGSALRNGTRPGEISPSGSPGAADRQQVLVIRRLTSIPAQKAHTQWTDNIIEGAKGVLYSFNLIHPILPFLVSALKDTRSKKSNIETVFNSASLHIERLDQELHSFDDMMSQGSKMIQTPIKNVAYATRECIMAHHEVSIVLMRFAKQMVRDLDPRYLRTFLHTLSHSMSEMLIACNYMGVDLSTMRLPTKSTQRVSTISEAPGEEEHTYKSDRSITPTQQRKPERRWGNSKSIQRIASHTDLPSITTENAFPSHSNNRSRSNSLARTVHHSTSSSIVNTPRSGESFSSVNWNARSRSGSTNPTAEQIRADKSEALQFEQIFSVVKKTVEEGSATIPQLHADFQHALSAIDTSTADPQLYEQWQSLAHCTAHFLEMTEAMERCLSMVKLNDREARNAKRFWQCVRFFYASLTDLLMALMKPMDQGVVSKYWKLHVKTLRLYMKEAMSLINKSPWSTLTQNLESQPTPQAMPQPQSGLPLHNGYQHRPRGSGSSTTGGSSPYPNNVPATPLSAALGPAAQATVPSVAAGSQVSLPPTSSAATIPATPGTASLERSFEGNIFQRADTYQQNFQQTIVPRRIK